MQRSLSIMYKNLFIILLGFFLFFYCVIYTKNLVTNNEISNSKENNYIISNNISNQVNDIGNLNGRKIEIPWFYMTGVITYADNKLDNREISKKRTFESEIKEFGFEFNYKTNSIWTNYNDHQHHNEIIKPYHTWVSLYVQSGDWYPAEPNIFLEELLKLRLKRYDSLDIPFFYQKTSYPDWSLNSYRTIIKNNINLKNMKISDKNDLIDYYRQTDDIFYSTNPPNNDNGKIVSYILCSNAPVINPPCEHILLINDKKLYVHLL